MGKGKGSVDFYTYISRSHRFLYEFSRKKYSLRKINYFFSRASIKLPGKTRIFYTRNSREKYYSLKGKGENRKFKKLF